MVATITVSAGGGLRDWGVALKPPGGSALWPVFLGEECLERTGEGSGEGSQGKSLETSVSLLPEEEPTSHTVSPVPFLLSFPVRMGLGEGQV